MNNYFHCTGGRFKVAIYVMVLLLAVFYTDNLRASGKKLKTRIKIEYFKKGDNTKQIKATASSRVNRKPVSLQNITLQFFDETDSSRLIQSITTNKKGIAVLNLPADYPMGKEEPSVFTVRFAGNDIYKPASKKIEVKDIVMNVDYKVVDSVYMVNVSAYELIDGKPGNPVSDVDVYVYVQRLFSLLKVGEGWLQDGKATVEIPNNIPGDRQQNLKLVTMIPEAEGYGTIENNKTMKWGTPLPALNKYADKKKRALWEPRAPLWMVITLGILLFGVFYHYFLIGFKLYKIKKIGEGKTVWWLKQDKININQFIKKWKKSV